MVAGEYAGFLDRREINRGESASARKSVHCEEVVVIEQSDDGVEVIIPIARESYGVGSCFIEDESAGVGAEIIESVSVEAIHDQSRRTCYNYVFFHQCTCEEMSTGHTCEVRR